MGNRKYKTNDMTNEELIELIQAGHSEYGNKLYQQNEAMIKAIVIGIANKNGVSPIEIEDMIGTGNLAFIDAVKRYESSRNSKFSTYAYIKIQTGVLEYLRKNNCVPVEVSRNRAKVAKYNDTYYIENGRYPTDDEIISELKLNKEQLQNVRLAGYFINYDSLYRKMDEESDDGITLMETIAASSDDIQELIDSDEDISDIVFSKITEKGRNVLFAYFFENKTTKEIAEEQGMTPQSVTNFKRKLLEKLAVNPSIIRLAKERGIG